MKLNLFVYLFSYHFPSGVNGKPVPPQLRDPNKAYWFVEASSVYSGFHLVYFWVVVLFAVMCV